MVSRRPLYVIGPLEGLGSAKEPLMAVGFSVLWGLWGLFYFRKTSKTRAMVPRAATA